MSKTLKFHGGKHYLSQWIISHFPPRTRWHLFREAYFGSGAVLFALDPEGLSEAVNDINGELMNFWNVLRNAEQFAKFQHRVALTPFSEDDFIAAATMGDVTPTEDWLRAWGFFVRNRFSRQGLGKDFATSTSRLRRKMNENVSAWLGAVDGLADTAQRLLRVEVRNMPALKFIKQYDHEKALHYCDPPYLPETRSGGGEYGENEMTPEDHEELLKTLAGIQGMFVLSGYPSELYADYANQHGWRCVQKKIDNKASSSKKKELKTECLWLNY